MTSLREVLEQASGHFNVEVAAGVEAVYQFSISDAGNYYLNVHNQKIQLIEGHCDNPSVSLAMDLETLKGIISGTIDGLQAFLFSRVSVTGNMRLAVKLIEMFDNVSSDEQV